MGLVRCHEAGCREVPLVLDRGRLLVRREVGVCELGVRDGIRGSALGLLRGLSRPRAGGLTPAGPPCRRRGLPCLTACLLAPASANVNFRLLLGWASRGEGLCLRTERYYLRHHCCFMFSQNRNVTFILDPH